MIRPLLVALLASAACAQDAASPAAQPTRPADAQPAPGQPPIPGDPLPAGSAAESWKGVITVPTGQTIQFTVVLQPPKDAAAPATGTMSIPLQGLTNGPLDNVALTTRAMRFRLAVPGAPPSAMPAFSIERNDDNRTAKGEMQQAGYAFQVTMERLKEGETVGPDRPQHPKPPFPYIVRDVEYANTVDGARFAGTLTLPEGKGPFPAALLITGSGPQDRDETLFAHKPFLVLADHLTRKGFAVLRVDDRGVGGSTSPKNGDETTDDFVGDALAGVAFLRAQPEIDPARVGLIGHSEGGLIGPMASARSADVAFLVLLAGPGVSGREVMTEQAVSMMRVGGAPADMIARARAGADAAAAAIIAGDAVAAEKGVRELVLAQLGRPAVPDAEPAAPDAQVDQAVRAAVARFKSPWFRRFLAIDPREYLRKVRVPILAINGELDVQVVHGQNVPEIEKALKDAGNPDATVKVLPGLNHLFQTSATGAFEEYAQLTETFAPAALDLISAWLNERFKKPR